MKTIKIEEVIKKVNRLLREYPSDEYYNTHNYYNVHMALVYDIGKLIRELKSLANEKDKKDKKQIQKTIIVDFTDLSEEQRRLLRTIIDLDIETEIKQKVILAIISNIEKNK